MPKICTVCRCLQREQIDLEIVNGTSIRDIAKRFDMSHSSVGRHRKNCHQAIVAATLESSKAAELLEAAREADEEATSLNRAMEMYRRCRKAAIEAFRRGDLKTGFLGAREARGYLDLIAKLSGEFSTSEPARQHQPMFTFQDPFAHIHFGGAGDIDCEKCEARKVIEEIRARKAERKALPPGDKSDESNDSHPG